MLAQAGAACSTAEQPSRVDISHRSTARHRSMGCRTAPHGTVLRSIVRCGTARHGKAQHGTAQHHVDGACSELSSASARTARSAGSAEDARHRMASHGTARHSTARRSSARQHAATPPSAIHHAARQHSIARHATAQQGIMRIPCHRSHGRGTTQNRMATNCTRVGYAARQQC